VGSLDGRVAIITGAGRGLGREHALLFAAEGAKVVVNNRVGAADASRPDLGPGHDVVEEIRAANGEAVLNTDDVADFEGARNLVRTAVDAFGGLDVLVNNAGILRDRMLVNMTADEWDESVRVNLRGHFCPTRWAADYWRSEAKAGRPRDASIVNTLSTSGLWGNTGQANYGATKGGIAALTLISQLELAQYGVRCNAISPSARTRMTARGLSGEAPPPDPTFDPRDAANISPFVAYLAMESCRVAGKLFFVRAGEVHVFQPWTLAGHVATDHRWTVSELASLAPFGDLEFETGSSIIRSAPLTS
jgi:NAD(P)-dependent dehydrogenase (short-subunit alcohol dehydrogenase family)